MRPVSPMAVQAFVQVLRKSPIRLPAQWKTYVFGHVDIPSTPFSLFGLYERFLPNTKIEQNPLDFQRYVVGVAYRYNQYLRLALDYQGLDYYHQQFTFPKGYYGVKSSVPDAVPTGIEAVFFNLEFAY